jgi:YD repeat-containing protein
VRRRAASHGPQKTLLASGLLDDVVYQDNHLVYDAQHRLRAVFDGRSDVRITYDLAGNRKQVTTHVINAIRTNDSTTGQQVPSADHTGTTTFEYDAMNRQVLSVETSVVKGARWVLDLRNGATPVVETTNTTHTYLYDLAGNRIQDETKINDESKKTYKYVYDDLHRIDSYNGASANDMMDGIKYDGAGRQVAARTLIGAEGGTYEYRYNQ